jgi:hypothetical protein
MKDWRATADAIIAEVHASLPADADLVTRRQACLRAKPWEFAVTSWGTKVWAKAQRAYLEKHGLPPREPKEPEQMLSPLERAKQRATHRHS